MTELAEEPTRVLLIRHASNDFVAAKRLPGRTPGVHLNEKGLAEAHAVAERLAAAPLAGVYSSPLERALETAGPIAERQGVPLAVCEALAETDCGEWTGETLESLSQTELWRQIQVAPSCARFPGGESIAEVQARVVAVVAELRSAHPGQTIAVVSHADPIKLLLAFHVGLHMDMFQRFVVAPASISEIAFGPVRPQLVRSNDCAHLGALGSEGS
jgi:probable phosphomutase (TIGR03848 family)